jgi:DNA-directed RNA polymerase subunit RPC12/RpoP
MPAQTTSQTDAPHTFTCEQCKREFVAVRGMERCTCPHCGVEYMLRFVDATWGQIALAEPLKPGVDAQAARRTLDSLEAELKRASVEVRIPLLEGDYVPFNERLKRSLLGLALGALACFIILALLILLTAG